MDEVKAMTCMYAGEGLIRIWNLVVRNVLLIYGIFFIHACAGMNTGSQNCMLKSRFIKSFDRKFLYGAMIMLFTVRFIQPYSFLF
jgi:hypothetical protein